MEALIKLLNGLFGYWLVVVVVLCIVAFLGFKAVKIQQEEATHYYKLDVGKIQMFEKNRQFYQVKE
ncbi:DUF4006 family protein [Helicobacter salomonis]|uniref:DUF4006 family protein n=1 Tax=Helicobacter salomonis TaxID=56878 RepID=UPI001F19022F|nr:DUF4006 family protein [Helicobacter salomonis]